MRNLKKFLALALAMMMTLSLMVTVNAASPKDFADKGSITKSYAEAVNVLSALSVVKGDDDGFRPGDPITRGEVAALIYRAATGDTSAKGPNLYKDYAWFGDVHESEWFAPYVNYCANAEWIKGDGNGWFNPYDNVTGYEVLAMILRAVGYGKGGEFEGPAWSIQTARIARVEGVTKKVSETTLGSAATREVVAELIFEAMQIPTVTWNQFFNYQKDVLVSATTKIVSGDTKVVYPNDVYNTLLYQSFRVVGKQDDLGRDDYGRPSTVWVTDHRTDTLENGGLYVVNHAGGKGKPDGASYTDEADGERLNIPYTPVATYYTAVSECQVATDVNGNDSIAWSKIKEYVNGYTVTDGERVGNMDALHTTVNTLGAQGRTTEIYNHAADADNDTWTFVYYDTLMGQVTNVIPCTYDTAGHLNSDAELWVAVNDTVKGTNVVKAYKDSDYTYKVGDLVLLTTYGGKGGTAITKTGSEAGSTVNDDILNAVPSAVVDFTVAGDTTPEWAVDIVGAPTLKLATVNATTGVKDDKTGLVGTDGVTYPATWAYHLDESDSYTDKDGAIVDQVANNSHAATAFSTDETVLDKFQIAIKNELIGNEYTLYLDTHGNIMGMTQAYTMNVGVITGMDSIRIGTGKYGVNVDMFMIDGSTKTFTMLKPSKALDGTETYTFFDTNAEADEEITAGGKYENYNKNCLVKIEPYTVEGNTYWQIVDSDSDKKAGVVDTDDKALTGVANALEDQHNSKDVVLNDNSVIIVAEYDYRYNFGGNINIGGNVATGYKVYNGFKTIPTINAEDTNLKSQVLDKDGKYVLIYSADETKDYTAKAQATINVDDSYLVVKPMATYAEYSTYSVVKNGQLTTMNVSNSNQTSVNSKIEAAMTGNKLIWVTGTNSKGHITNVETVDDIISSGDAVQQAVAAANVGQLATTATITKDTIDTDKSDLNASVLNVGGTKWLTISATCEVKIVNKDNGQLYPATLASIFQYEETHDIVVELDNLGYVNYVYIVD